MLSFLHLQNEYKDTYNEELGAFLTHYLILTKSCINAKIIILYICFKSIQLLLSYQVYMDILLLSMPHFFLGHSQNPKDKGEEETGWTFTWF